MRSAFRLSLPCSMKFRHGRFSALTAPKGENTCVHETTTFMKRTPRFPPTVFRPGVSVHLSADARWVKRHPGALDATKSAGGDSMAPPRVGEELDVVVRVDHSGKTLGCAVITQYLLLLIEAFYYWNARVWSFGAGQTFLQVDDTSSTSRCRQ